MFGLILQMVIYQTEIAVFHYLLALGAAAVVIPLSTTIVFYLNRNIKIKEQTLD